MLSESIKNRKLDTRHKIELGGLVIKAGLNSTLKSPQQILGSLIYTMQLLEQDSKLLHTFEHLGKEAFNEKEKKKNYQ